MIKIDLHTHSTASPDGGISIDDYREALDSGKLQAIAITDHDRIDRAIEIQAELGDRIIVGEEITTTSGEIIGLYLKKRIASNMSARKTAEAIRAQNGLVYIPHPFETMRKGIQPKTLESISDLVDIIEAYNGRALFQNRGPLAVRWARLNSKSIAASSDAHGRSGLGLTYSIIESQPTSKNLVSQLGLARFNFRRPSPLDLIYPKANRLKKKLRGKNDA